MYGKIEPTNKSLYLMNILQIRTRDKISNNKVLAMSTASTSNNPTLDFYGHLDSAFVFFNDRLFEGKLPKIMFELTNKKQVAGLFKAASWQATDGVFVHSIAINPQIIVQSTPLVIYITLVKEMVHLWQKTCGTPSRPGYHNGEWSEKLESIGLMPSTTGFPDGKKVGQKMSCYLIGGGAFEAAAVDFFLDGNFINLVDASIDDADVLKLRNQLLLDCVNKNQSLTEYYAGWQSKAIEYDSERQPSEVLKIKNTDYNDDLSKSLSDKPVSDKPNKSDHEDLGITAPRKKDKVKDKDKADDAADEDSAFIIPTPSNDTSFAKSHDLVKEVAAVEVAATKADAVEVVVVDDENEDDFDDSDFDEPNFGEEQSSIFNLSEVSEGETLSIGDEILSVGDDGLDTDTGDSSDTNDSSDTDADVKGVFEEVISRLVVEPIQNTSDIVGVPEKPKYDFNKTKYQCPNCSNNVWGKPSMNILCVDCDSIFDVAK